PGWYPDPSGQHDKRYWDGSAWTEQVTSRAVDPVAPTLPAPHGDPYFAAVPATASLPPTTERYAGSVPPAAPVAAPPRLHILQKITPFQNVYRVHWDANGQPGELVAFVKQKRMALKEAFTVFADEAATRAVVTIKADRRIDIRSAMTITDATTGQVVGAIRKKGAASIVRSTWELEQPGLPPLTITERNMAIAILRRVWGLIPYANNVPVPWVFHFDAVTADGSTVFTHTRIWGWRDRYVMEIQDQRLDFRMAVSIGILMDAMQHR
ncbi:MAG TPA: DUF2510 domain-containing protein, partial [Mycobacteriales bacterium]|nr:DUF2510 domain-containing protein [Mycobacteriales bacterium]